jgi:hypothetical protein
LPVGLLTPQPARASDAANKEICQLRRIIFLRTLEFDAAFDTE